MERKRVGVLTFHMAHNYGAMLQAYALPTVLREIGVNCETIDYRFPYIDNWSRVERMKDLIARHGALGGGLRYVKRILTGYYSKDVRRIRFDKFERKVIPHSKKTYRSKSELDNMPYDIFLFGSDQIWNYALTNGVAEEYIGGFKCASNSKKISYAASCGSFDFQEESREIYNKYLQDFYAISVREEMFMNALSSRGFDVECVLDPTLLLSADDWKKLFVRKKEPICGKYLLLYVFDEDEKIYDIAREYACERDLEIVVIAYKKKDAMYGMNVLTECGPLEFLALFSKAEHVITSSFHGTAFSIIFHKSFHCVPHPKYRERTDSLLKLLELENHNMNEVKSIENIETDWDKVDFLLAENRDESIRFLKRTIV